MQQANFRLSCAYQLLVVPVNTNSCRMHFGYLHLLACLLASNQPSSLHAISIHCWDSTLLTRSVILGVATVQDTS